MDFRDVVAFVNVARLESFSRAAEKLHLAQSALSRRVLRLEQHLGVPLLERHPRGVRATSAGQVLLGRAEKLEAEMRQIEEEIRALGRAAPQELRLAMPQGAARLFAGAVVDRYRKLWPQVKLHLYERGSASNREAVLAGETDLVLLYGVEPSPELIMTPLLLERLLVLGPPRSRAEQAPPAGYDLEELARLPLILPGHPHGYRRIVEQVTARKGLTPNIILEVNGFATSLTMVQQGLGYTISTYPPAQGAIEAGTLVGIPILSPECEVELCMAHRVNCALPDELVGLKNVIQEVSASVPPSAYWRAAS